MTQSERALHAADRREPPIDPDGVLGWGVDADAENDPTWPMRDRSLGPDGPEWPRPSPQQSDVEILQSVEHQRRPAAFGTAEPPSGLSGAVRRAAFRFSESQWGHWLLLMLADRINVVEGLAGDLRRGRLPNPVAEMGLVPRSKARQAGVATAVGAGLGVVALVWLLRRRGVTPAE